jgi:hypothetical protein
LQVLQTSALSILVPSPLQSLQCYLVDDKNPGPNWTTFSTTPNPLHLAHFLAFAPPFPPHGSHVLYLVIGNFIIFP